MSYFRITLHRSAIGLPKRTRGVLAALGLHRRAQVVFHPVSAQFAGMIMKVKELVRIEEVERPMTKRELHESRRPEPGFWVETPRASSFGMRRVLATGQQQQQQGEGQQEGVRL
ncbi:ribosomal protein L30-containing protein [Parathielavia appendiculata]|uniref:Large ribosomal subunit protein uL30m n=1 Tax=Parathielavia appendiculata TaxID=2587402 RepID=A0AAN6TYN5_9PEZI|nr:ribosomal protein L30-containing protein [Parathielavia appendiculata]